MFKEHPVTLFCCGHSVQCVQVPMKADSDYKCESSACLQRDLQLDLQAYFLLGKIYTLHSAEFMASNQWSFCCLWGFFCTNMKYQK